MRLFFPMHFAADAPTPTLAPGWPATTRAQWRALTHRWPGAIFAAPGSLTLEDAMRALGTLPRDS